MEIVGNPYKLENEILNRHFIGYEEYSEIKLQLPKNEDGYCYRCGKRLEPLTYYDPDFYYVACHNCLAKRKKKAEIESIIQSTKEYYCDRILGDRYLQLFLVDPIYYRNTLPHQYSVFKKIVSELKPPSRNDIWFLDWSPGFPHIISEENLPGIQIKNVTSQLSDGIISDKDKIVFENYEVLFPEMTNYEKHYSRYNIFNSRANNRRTKRFKVGDKCYRLNNTLDPNVKSIFRLKKDGKDISVGDISHRDFVILKLLIMRNRYFLKLVFDIVLESMKLIGVLRDSVFLINTIELDGSKSDTSLTLLWDSVSKFKNNSGINLSIL